MKYSVTNYWICRLLHDVKNYTDLRRCTCLGKKIPSSICIILHIITQPRPHPYACNSIYNIDTEYNSLRIKEIVI